MEQEAGDRKTTDNDDWRNEDPNLLNIPELLYRETDKLPVPNKVDPARELELWNVRKMIRELILDHNVILDELSQQERIQASEEIALRVLRKFAEVLHLKVEKCAQKCAELQNMDIWDEANMQEVFSKQGSEKIFMWKTALNQFLECFSNIRKFIPKEALEPHQNAPVGELEKKQLSCLPSIAEELEHLQDILQHFMEV